MRRAFSVFVIFGLLAGIGSTPAMGSNLYWGSVFTDTMLNAPMDGSGPINTIIASAPSPRGVDTDPIGGKLYYGGSGIFVADLDGSNPTSLIGVASPYGISVDPAAGKIYWASDGLCKICSANLDGTGATDLYTGLSSNGRGIEVDPGNGMLYWSEYASGTGIWTAPADGSGTPTMVLPTSGEVNDIALDLANGKVYWSEFNKIRMGNMDGTGTPVDVVTDLTAALSLDFDPMAEQLYYYDFEGWSNGVISRVDADGSNPTVVYNSGVGYTFGMALDAIPEPATLSLLALGVLALVRHRR